MEKMLQKLAHQLNCLDESSLTSLWDSLVARVERFEPSKAWEEAVLALSMVQAMRWKNQLFNYYWSQSVKAGTENAPSAHAQGSFANDDGRDGAGPDIGHASKQRCKILSFRPVKNDETV